MNDTATLTASQINYLIALYRLERKDLGVRCVDVAKELDISKPSVHTMMKTLDKLGYICKSRYGNVYLSDDGRHAAGRYSEAYAILADFFSVYLKIPDEKIKRPVLAVLSELPVEDIERMCERLRTSGHCICGVFE